MPFLLYHCAGASVQGHLCYAKLNLPEVPVTGWRRRILTRKTISRHGGGGLFRVIGPAITGTMWGCGGSGMVRDFSLSVDATSVQIAAGGAAHTVTVSSSAINGFSQSIHVSISALPSGVTASPDSFTLAAGSSQQVSFSATALAPAAVASVQFTGTAGSSTHAAAIMCT